MYVEKGYVGRGRGVSREKEKEFIFRVICIVFGGFIFFWVYWRVKY